MTDLSAIQYMTDVQRIRAAAHLAPMSVADAVRAMNESNFRISAVLAIEVDSFQAKQRRLGRRCFDDLMAALIGSLELSVCEEVSWYRVGAAKLLVALRRPVGPEDVRCDLHLLTRDVVRTLSRDYAIKGEVFKLGVSIGAAPYFETSTLEIATQCALNALASAHAKGGCCAEVWDVPAYGAEIPFHTLEILLARALQKHEFSLRYQPKVRLSDNRLTGFECLLSWNSPEFGMISPTVFIPIAERTGLIHSIGAWVLDSACNRLRTWHDMGYSNLTMAINVSPVQLERGIYGAVRDAILINGLTPNSLELELTESAVLHAEEAIHMIKKLGLKVAIDDFGTGCTGLSYLVSLPIDTLKIDKSFIQELANSRRHAVVTEGIVRVAHQLGMEVVAEGIETMEMYAAAETIGCVTGQGYLFSRPLSEKDATIYLQTAGAVQAAMERASAAHALETGTIDLPLEFSLP